MFYFNLAKNNIKKNALIYKPYLLISMLMVVIFYIMLSISNNSDIDNLMGSQNIKVILSFGTVVTGIFSIIFLFYISSFIMKRRKTELGLYNILGLEKKHIIKVLLLESIITGAITVILGIILGIIIEKIFYLLFLKLIGEGVKLGFNISFSTVSITAIFFIGLNIILFLWNAFEIKIASTISLLKSKDVGEKEPKVKVISLIIGIISLGIGYYLAYNIENPLYAISTFFIAVILVMEGTYNLFLSGSIFILKCLKKNKMIYYKTNNFISISTMIYRMKKNAIGLANICILSTAVIIVLSSTSSLYVGSESFFQHRYIKDIDIYVRKTNMDTVDKIETIINKANINSIEGYRYKTNLYAENGENFKEENTLSKGSVSLVKIPVSDYNRIENENLNLGKDEILIFSNRGIYHYKEINLNGKKYSAKSIEDVGTFYAEEDEDNLMPVYFAIVNDSDIGAEFSYKADFNANNKDEIIKEYNNIKKELKKIDVNILVDNKISARKDFNSLYGSFLFIGLLLGTVFLFATILIIYYKQLNEGYEDRERFNIMQKVGMEDKEIKKIIRKQVAIVFLSPVVVASIHLFFAFPMIKKILYMLNLRNDNIFILMAVITVVIFLIIYSIVFYLTSRVYYKIVKQ